MTTSNQSTDLVARLRDRAGKYDEYDWHSAVELEAADEIERLTAINRLRFTGLPESRRLLLLDAADDCIECANYLLGEAPNMGSSKEKRYRALADESVARAAALRKWAEESTSALDATTEPK